VTDLGLLSICCEWNYRENTDADIYKPKFFQFRFYISSVIVQCTFMLWWELDYRYTWPTPNCKVIANRDWLYYIILKVNCFTMNMETYSCVIWYPFLNSDVKMRAILWYCNIKIWILISVLNETCIVITTLDRVDDFTLSCHFPKFCHKLILLSHYQVKDKIMMGRSA